MATLTDEAMARLGALEGAIDDYDPVFRKLRNASGLAEYLAARGDRADEEILTEPILRSIIERVLGFPKGRYLEQLSRSGRKPDFTPEDLLAHPFVLDAKASDEILGRHELQIRAYMEQRRLAAGILFNLREIKVYRRGARGEDALLRLLHEGRELVERVERLVCAVYDVPEDLTDRVVAHAVRRAG